MSAAIEVWKSFIKLGFTAFGGPVAHIGFFRQEFVERQRWLTDNQFSQLLAICQFLPGPASSQMGMAIGLIRAGWAGAFAAFIAFTLPSAIVLFGFAGLAMSLDNATGIAIINGLKLVAVAVVAHALLGMSKTLTPDWTRRGIAFAAVIILLLATSTWMQLLVILLGGIVGIWLCQARHLESSEIKVPYSQRSAVVLGMLFTALLLASFLSTTSSESTPFNLFANFYQAGALVFGGGHVVLPLLEQGTVGNGWMTTDTFLAGYGAAQAVPGPLFTLSTYLGANIDTGLASGWSALIATLAIFLPGFLLLLALLPFWGKLTATPKAAAAVAGVNAAVVGLLAAAWYDPVITSSIKSWADIIIAIAGFMILAVLKKSALWTVLFCVLASLLFSVLM